MSAKPFLDTNIIVYSFDKSAPEKRAKSLKIIRDPDSRMISWKVVQEFCNVALHRFATPMLAADMEDYLRLILLPACRVMPTPQLFQQAIRIQSQTKYHFYDSLVVASALAAGAETLLSEDLQSDRVIGNLRIVNPYASGD
jgi:predicted nucleic acid-binding protein